MGQLELLLIKWFGVNYKTTLYGGMFTLSSIASIISANPQNISFLPEEIRNKVLWICGIIVTISGILFARNSKDKSVTGIGSTAQICDEGKMRTEKQIEKANQ